GLLGLALLVVATCSRMPPGLLASLAALYAVVFFYHRNYDTMILALPLAFASGYARIGQPTVRWWMTVAALCILVAMYLPRKALFLLLQSTFQPAFVASLVEFIVLPSATLCVLASMLCLWVGAKHLTRDARITS